MPSEDLAVIPLFSLMPSGQIKLRKIDGWWKIATVLSQHSGWSHDAPKARGLTRALSLLLGSDRMIA